MLVFNHKFKRNSRERILEMRIDSLKGRIRELERRSPLIYPPPTDNNNKIQTNGSSFLVLPVTYTPTQEPSPKLEIVPNSSNDQSKIPLLLVEQSKSTMYETVV